MINLEGIMTAIVTPLNEDMTINEQQLEKLLEFQIENGVHSVLAIGGTGEFTPLTMSARKQMVDATVRIVNKRIPVVIGNLEPGIGESIAFTRYCEQAGADAVLIMTPFYVHPTQQGLIDFYTKVDQETNIPFLIYNIPYRTYVNMTAETLEILCGKCRKLVGIKECNASPSQAIEMIRRCGDQIHVLSGEEYLSPMLMALGAKGAVMASANLIPGEWVAIWDLIRNKKASDALDILGNYAEVIAAMFGEINPGPLKYGLELMNLPCGPTAIPLTPVSAAAAERLKKAMEKAKLI